MGALETLPAVAAMATTLVLLLVVTMVSSDTLPAVAALATALVISLVNMVGMLMALLTVATPQTHVGVSPAEARSLLVSPRQALVLYRHHATLNNPAMGLSGIKKL